MQAGIEYEMRAIRTMRDVADLVEQPRTDAAALLPRGNNEVVNIEETNVQRVHLQTIAGEAEDGA